MKRYLSFSLVIMMLILVTAPSFATTAPNEDKYGLSKYTIEELIDLRKAVDIQIWKSSNSDIGTESNITDYLYASNGKEIRINAYVGSGGTVRIPNEIDGLPVTSLAKQSFYDCRDVIEGLILPDCLKEIGDSAICYSGSLSGILVLPKTLKKVEGHAFQGSSLTGLVVQSDCSIELNSFANISSLEFIYIKEGSAPIIDRSTFSYAEALTTVVIPSSVKKIADETFDGCNYMKIVTPKGSYAEKYAKRNFISCDTDSYADYVKLYDALLKDEISQ